MGFAMRHPKACADEIERTGMNTWSRRERNRFHAWMCRCFFLYLPPSFREQHRAPASAFGKGGSSR